MSRPNQPAAVRSSAAMRIGREDPLPSDDPVLARPDLDLDTLAERWSVRAGLPAMTAEQMRGADLRTQRLGTPGDRLMEEAGIAVAAAVRALLTSAERPAGAVVLILCGPGNNGGDGLVAARHLAGAGHRVAAVLVSSEAEPSTRDAARNWQRLADVTLVERIHAATAREVQVLLSGVEKAAVVVDALLGTGIRGVLREPIRSAVTVIGRARQQGVPVLAIDSPTAVDLTGGTASDPVVRADVTVTFHRPKTGLRTRIGKALAGRILVAPIGIPPEADPT
ncbi:MAG: NAD(P)H-hydrate epimerase [Chloroflexi bacterium]|nr:NAD(P)H-hydrate epimerase [Chloroflexota bacterium]MBA3851462.1 NAD(P)H-hydrate epimerase [Chloroflexota bacterium]MDQ3407602.1 NAD(P)H-hydrate epimerase [Chloroflexota bacterium]